LHLIANIATKTIGSTPLNKNQLMAETSTWQHATLTRDRHLCPWRDWNPHFQ